jgi:hypothetical protein
MVHVKVNVNFWDDGSIALSVPVHCITVQKHVHTKRKLCSS